MLSLPSQDRGLLHQHADAVEDRVVEVETALGEHPPLVFGVDTGRLRLGGDQRICQRICHPGRNHHVRRGSSARGPRGELLRRDELLFRTLDQLQELGNPVIGPLGVEEVRRPKG